MTKSTKTVAVIGGGAAGFFGAIACAQRFPGCEVTIFEKSPNLLAKVRVSGGGRCNVTHDCPAVPPLLKGYPRGSRELKGAFHQFGVADTVRWFEERGIALKTEADGRMFPTSNSSQTIVDCLYGEARSAGVRIVTRAGVTGIEVNEQGPQRFTLHLLNHPDFPCDAVLVATGGNPSLAAYRWLEELGHAIVPPVPSLFTFNVPENGLSDLAGVAERGPVLVTHWGLSGPAVLRLSAWAARELNQAAYQFTALVNWLPSVSDEELRTQFMALRESDGKKAVAANPKGNLPARLWKRLTERAGITPETRWADLPRKNFNRLVEELKAGNFAVAGKTTYKEEFVTCCGVALSEINPDTMESRRCPGLFLAGEVLDADGITGGYNFQHAWTSGYLAGQHLGKTLEA